MIIANNINKTFKRGWIFKEKVEVLKNFSFTAHPGRVTGLIGPNGAGKTTFFRILCGLEKIDSGTLTVNGLDPNKNPVSMRGKIALLPEEPGVSKETSGKDHLKIFGIMMGLSEKQINQSLEQANEYLHMDKYWHRPFMSYSKGQKARIALARMRFMPDANVLIFDEPSNGLDFEAVGRLHRYIRDLALEGKTVLVSSHILADLKHLCDDLVGINDGRQASVDEIKNWLDAHSQSQGSLAKNNNLFENRKEDSENE